MPVAKKSRAKTASVKSEITGVDFTKDGMRTLIDNGVVYDAIRAKYGVTTPVIVKFLVNSSTYETFLNSKFITLGELYYNFRNKLGAIISHPTEDDVEKYPTFILYLKGTSSSSANAILPDFELKQSKPLERSFFVHLKEFRHNADLKTSVINTFSNLVDSASKKYKMFFRVDKLDDSSPTTPRGFKRVALPNQGFWHGEVTLVTGDYDTIEEIWEDSAKPTFEQAAEVWASRIMSSIKSEVQTIKKKIEEAEKKVVTLSATYGEKRQLEKMLETSAVGVFAKMVEEIKSVPGVEKLEFGDGELLIETEHLYTIPRNRMSASGTGRKYIGKFIIVVGTVKSYTYFINMVTPNGVTHTHGDNEGWLCSGSYPMMIASAFKAFDFELVLSSMIALLQHTDFDDWGAKGRYQQLPEKPITAQSRWKATGPTSLFGEHTSSPFYNSLTSLSKVNGLKYVVKAYNPSLNSDDDDDDDDDED